MKRIRPLFRISLLSALLIAGLAHAQSQPAVHQTGAVTNGHIVTWVAPNLVQDGGTPSGTGTVTSVGVTGDNGIFNTSFSGTPITAAGTINLSANLKSNTANKFFASPSGSSGTGTMRLIVGADLPLATSSAFGAVNVPINGGLGLAAGSLSLAAPTTSVLGGIIAASGATSNSWVTYVDTSGNQHVSTINFSNLAGTAAIGQGGTGLTTLGSAHACLQVNASATALVYDSTCTGSTSPNINIGTTLSTANPSLQSDATTGLYTSGASRFSAIAAGAEVMRWSTTGAALTGSMTISGNVTSGGWQGTAVATQYGGTGQNFSGSTGVMQLSSGTASASAALANGTTATTQSASDNSTKVATTAYVDRVTGVATLPTRQSFLSGSGTYTTPANVKWIEVMLVGAGGGGGGSGTGGGTGGTGGNTTFGSSCLTGNGGPGGAFNGTAAAGGTASIGGCGSGQALTGGAGGGANSAASTFEKGGQGGNTPLGGGAGGQFNGAGDNGATNTGGGGAGGGTGAGVITTAAGGAGAGYVSAIITSPSATYAYAVGAGGTAGTAGTSGNTGGTGGSGGVWVIEHYNY